MLKMCKHRYVRLKLYSIRVLLKKPLYLLTSAAIIAYRYSPFLKKLDPQSSNNYSHF